MATSVGGIELRHVIGQGGFGKVMLGYDKKNKKDVAVKVIDKQLVEENALQSYVEREIEILRRVKHEHIVRLISVIDSSKGYYLVMELANGGELFDKIVESKRFDEKTARDYFQQLISAVHYCHEHNIVHRDLKAENLLLGSKGELKVCDFGLSRYTTKKGSFTSSAKDQAILFTSLAGSTDYQAPEVIQEGGYEGHSCDIWSCGVILFFMLCGYLPFADRNDDLTKKRILSASYNKNAKYLSEGARDLISKMLVINPKQRLDTKGIIGHPWFLTDLDAKGLGFDESLMSPMLNGSLASAANTVKHASPESPTTEANNCQANKEMIHQAFISCNVDQTGFLTRDEVRDVLIKLNSERQVQPTDVDEFMRHFELDDKGRITEEQFILGWTKERNAQDGFSSKYSLSKLANIFHFSLERELLAALRTAFDSLDVGHKGLIKPSDFQQLQLGLSADEVKQLFDTVDPDHRGLAALNFENFVNFCTKYDFLQKHPISVRLKRLESLFDVCEFQGFRSYISTGFTVRGLREVLVQKLKTEAPTVLRTTIHPGETEGYLYGSFSDDETGRKVLEVGMQLLPAAQGYTKVLTYRIGGKTEIFHKWFRDFRKMLREEILMCAEDTAIRGESELM